MILPWEIIFYIWDRMGIVPIHHMGICKKITERYYQDIMPEKMILEFLLSGNKMCISKIRDIEFLKYILVKYSYTYDIHDNEIKKILRMYNLIGYDISSDKEIRNNPLWKYRGYDPIIDSTLIYHRYIDGMLDLCRNISGINISKNGDYGAFNFIRDIVYYGKKGSDYERLVKIFTCSLNKNYEYNKNIIIYIYCKETGYRNTECILQRNIVKFIIQNVCTTQDLLNKFVGIYPEYILSVIFEVDIDLYIKCIACNTYPNHEEYMTMTKNKYNYLQFNSRKLVY